MAKQRVQVGALAAPQAIQPAPVQSDTFVQPAQAPIDNNIERLAQALGHFGSGVKAYLDDPERKKALRDKQLAEYEAWTAARKNSEIVDAVKAGTVPWWTDPYIGEMVRRDGGARVAEQLSTELDQELQNNGIPDFGRPNFNSEAHVIQKAQPWVQRMQGDASSLTAFNNHLDTVKKSFRAKSDEARGIIQTAAIEDTARRYIDNSITTGIENGLSGDALANVLRPIYKDLGPRVKGGSLDIKYSRMDDLVMEVLEQRASNPAYAREIMRMLRAQRLGIEDDKAIIPALADTNRHADKATAIEKTAIKAIGDEQERLVKAGVLNSDVAALVRRDGTFFKITDASTTVEGGREVSFTAQKRKDEATMTALQRVRERNGGQENVAEELELVRRNSVAHPEWIPTLKGTFTGLGTSLSSGVGTEQVQAITKAGELFNRIADGGWNYLDGQLDEKTRNFYELYTTLRRDAAMSPDSAAATVARVYSSKENNQDPGVTARRREEIASKAKNMVFGPWYGVFPVSIWTNATPENKLLVSKKITSLAEAYALADGISIDDAVKRAETRVSENAVFVNGSAILDAGIMKGDEEHVNTLFGDLFKGDGLADKARIGRFKDLDIDGPEDLTILPMRNGIFLVKRKAGGDVTVPRVVGDKIVGESPLYITQEGITTVRAAAEVRKEAENRKEAIRQNEIDRIIRPYRPHNLLRGLFGNEPTD